MRDPSAFVSYWEADEQGVQEATEEEIKSESMVLYIVLFNSLKMQFAILL